MGHTPSEDLIYLYNYLQMPIAVANPAGQQIGQLYTGGITNIIITALTYDPADDTFVAATSAGASRISQAGQTIADFAIQTLPQQTSTPMDVAVVDAAGGIAVSVFFFRAGTVAPTLVVFNKTAEVTRLASPGRGPIAFDPVTGLIWQQEVFDPTQFIGLSVSGTLVTTLTMLTASDLGNILKLKYLSSPGGGAQLALCNGSETISAIDLTTGALSPLVIVNISQLWVAGPYGIIDFAFSPDRQVVYVCSGTSNAVAVNSTRIYGLF